MGKKLFLTEYAPAPLSGAGANAFAVLLILLLLCPQLHTVGQENIIHLIQDDGC